MRAVFGPDDDERAGPAAASCCAADRVDERPAQPRPAGHPRPALDRPQPPLPGRRWRRSRRRCWRRCGAAAPKATRARTSSRCWSTARYEDGSPMSEQDLRDELLTLLTDGPTSTSLAWTFERLLRNPEKLARAATRSLAGDGALPRRGDQGDAAGPPAGPGGGAAAAGADAAGRLRPAGGDHRRPLHPPDPPQRGDLPAGRELHPRALPRAASPAPTPGSPSAAAPAAASPPATPNWR